MQEFLSVDVSWVVMLLGARAGSAVASVHPSTVSVFGQGEVLCPCLHDVLRHVLAFQQGLSWLIRTGREGSPCNWQKN